MNTANHPQSADALYTVGYWLLEQRRHEDAKHVFRTMLLVAPADERGWLGLGNAHEGLCELDAASRLYTLARKACPQSVRSALALGRVLRKLDRADDASEAYDEAAELALELHESDLAASIELEARAA
jgi:tetratricopeptide (TPR) repeat protein